MVSRHTIASLVVIIHALAAPALVVGLVLGAAVRDFEVLRSVRRPMASPMVVFGPTPEPAALSRVVGYSAIEGTLGSLATRDGSSAHRCDARLRWTDVAHVRREVLTRFSLELAELRRQGALVPIHSPEGRVAGARIAGLRRDHLLHLMGFRDGDEILGVDGQPFWQRSPFVGSWARIPSLVTFDVTRSGRRGSLVFVVEEVI